MDKWLMVYGAAFCGGCAVCLLLTPLFRVIAAKTGFMDVPANNHKGHGKATPLLGGAAMFLSWVAVLLGGILVLWYVQKNQPSLLDGIDFGGLRQASREMIFLVGAALGAVLLGLIDDK